MKIKNIQIAIIILFSMGLTACNPKSLPVIKDIIKYQDEKNNKETKKAIDNSIALQELDKFCQEIPILLHFELLGLNMSRKRKSFLFYNYKSSMAFENAKLKYYEKYFTNNEWKVENKVGGWGPDWMEFQNNKFKVRITHSNSGEFGEANYLINCEDFSN
jgi:hypothetical protein